MIRNIMKLVISDSVVPDVKLAMAREQHDRRQAFDALLRAGHVRIIDNDDAARIHVQCDDEVFTDERYHFPTTVMMAKLQLAVAAGRSCVGRYFGDREYVFPQLAGNDARRFLLDDELTATVNLSGTKGLRP